MSNFQRTLAQRLIMSKYQTSHWAQTSAPKFASLSEHCPKILHMEKCTRILMTKGFLQRFLLLLASSEIGDITKIILECLGTSASAICFNPEIQRHKKMKSKVIRGGAFWALPQPAGR